MTKQAKLKTAEVIKVYDGDTIRCSDNERIRYLRVDTPEKGCPGCAIARKLNEKLVLHKTIKYQSVSRDAFARLLCEVWLPDGRNVNDILIANGFGE